MRELSSSWTHFYKFVFPTAWIVIFALWTILLFLSGEGFESRGLFEFRWWFLGAALLGSLFLYLFCMRLKKIRLVGDTLLISDFRRHAEVPLREVERVSGGVLLTPEFLWLHFKRPTRFGTKVVFMPPRRRFGFSRHPLAGELQALVERSSV